VIYITEEMWKEISEDLLESRSKYIPLKITQKGGYPKWIKKKHQAQNK